VPEASSRRKSGGYKRGTLVKLLTDTASHVIVDGFVEWPEMNQVYVLSDYRRCMEYEPELFTAIG
jgi:hypothetical protein